MNDRAVAFLDRAQEALLLVCAAALPLAFDLLSYDTSLVKDLTLQIAALLAGAFWIARGLEAGRFELPAGREVVTGLGAALLAWSAMSLFWNPYPEASFLYALRGLSLLVLFLSAVTGPASSGLALSLADWTLAATTAAAAYALAQKAGLDPLAWSGAFGDRAFSTLQHPRFLGALAAAAWPLSLGRLSDPEAGLARRVATAGAGAFALAGVWAADSTAAAGTLVAGSAVFATRLLSASGDRRARSLALAGAVVAAAVFSAWPWASREEAVLAAARTASGGWQGATAMIAVRPLSGWGLGSFASVFPEFRPAWLTDEGLGASRLDHPRCELLLIGAELGWIGLALALALVCAILAPAWRNAGERLRRGDGRLGGLAAGLWASCAALAGASLATPALASPALAFLVAVEGASLAVLAREAGSSIVRVLPVPATPLARLALSRLAVLGAAAGLLAPTAFWASDRTLNRAVFLSRSGGADEAAAALRRVWLWHPRSGAARALSGSLFAARNASGDASRALGEYFAAERIDPGLPRLALRKALVEMRLAHWREAQLDLRRASLLQPWAAASWERLVEVEWILGRPEEARRAALALVKLEPDNPERWRQLAQAYRRIEKPLVARRMERHAARIVDLARSGSLAPVY